MQASHQAIAQENAILSNSDPLKKLIWECAEEYSECDKVSKEMNTKRAAIREKIKDKGIPTDAFLHEYQYYKKKRHDQSGYDDGRSLCHEALNKAKTGELFAWNEKPAPKEKKPSAKAEKPAKSGKGKPVMDEATQIIAKTHAA